MPSDAECARWHPVFAMQGVDRGHFSVSSKQPRISGYRGEDIGRALLSIELFRRRFRISPQSPPAIPICLTVSIPPRGRPTRLLATAMPIPPMDVTVYGQLRAVTGEKTVHIGGDVETVDEALNRFLEAYPRAEGHVLDEAGEPRPSVRILLDGERVDLDSDCPPDASLQLFPAMEGGCPGSSRSGEANAAPEKRDGPQSQMVRTARGRTAGEPARRGHTPRGGPSAPTSTAGRRRGAGRSRRRR